MSGIADLGASVFGLVGMFFGGLLTWIVIAPAQSQAGGTDGGTVSSELLAAQLRSEALLEDIAKTLPTLAGGPSAAPLRTEEGQLSAEALAARLASLEETLVRLTAALGRVGGGQDGVGTPLVYDPSRLPATELLEQLATRPPVDRDFEHLGWTMQQVIDAYGRPTENYASNEAVQQRWFYDLEKGSLGFFFIDGRVVKVID